VIVPDCDRQAALATRVAVDLAAHAADVRVVDLDPSRDDGYDVGDLLEEAAVDGEKGISSARLLLERMADAAGPFRPAASDGASAIPVGMAEEAVPPEAEDGAALLDEVVVFIRRYMVISESQLEPEA